MPRINVIPKPKKEKKPNKKYITYLGKRVAYNKITDLQEKLNINRDVARKLISEPEYNIYIHKYKGKKLGDVEKINIKQLNPHLYREYGIKSFNKIINDNKKVKTGDYIISNTIDTDGNFERIRYNFELNVTFGISEMEVTRKVSAPLVYKNIDDQVRRKVVKKADDEYYFESTIQNIGNQILDYLINYYKPVDAPLDKFYPNKLEDLYKMSKEGDLDIYNTYSKQRFELTDTKLREMEPLNIFNQWLNIDTNESNSNCVKNYLLKQLPKMGKKRINKLGDDDGITGKQIGEFCKNFNIEYSFYNINGKLVDSFKPEKRNKSYKALYMLIYNNHLYGIKNKYLEKKPLTIKDNKNLYVDIKDKLHKKDKRGLLTKTQFRENSITKNNEIVKNLNYYVNKKKVIPQKINITNNKITSFIVDDTNIMINEDFDFCKKVLDTFGIGDKMTYGTNKMNILETLEKLYI